MVNIGTSSNENKFKLVDVDISDSDKVGPRQNAPVNHGAENTQEIQNTSRLKKIRQLKLTALALGLGGSITAGAITAFRNPSDRNRVNVQNANPKNEHISVTQALNNVQPQSKADSGDQDYGDEANHNGYQSRSYDVLSDSNYGPGGGNYGPGGGNYGPGGGNYGPDGGNYGPGGGNYGPGGGNYGPGGGNYGPDGSNYDSTGGNSGGNYGYGNYRSEENYANRNYFN